MDIYSKVHMNQHPSTISILSLRGGHSSSNEYCDRKRYTYICTRDLLLVAMKCGTLWLYTVQSSITSILSLRTGHSIINRRTWVIAPLVLDQSTGGVLASRKNVFRLPLIHIVVISLTHTLLGIFKPN